ncbi:MAG: PucR family transcriptional regulator [Solirubrobacterales bacterium]|nr:PucR family transcriptional regulator [Solirubrobacterales bacterium]
MSAPILREAEVLGGERFLDSTEIRWVAVTEPPVGGFIRPGELVLTTGLGCDEAQLVDLVRDIVAEGAAAICFSFPEGADVSALPADAIAVAEESELPIISTPWNVRFAEIIMAVTDRIIAQQHAAALAEPDFLLRSVTSTAMEGAGLTAVAEALETVTNRATLILSPSLHLLACGQLANERLTEALSEWDGRLDELSAEQVREYELALGLETASWVEGIPELGVGPGMSVGARVGRRVVALVYAVLDGDIPFIPALEGRAVTQSSIAVAMEMMRLKAAAAAEQEVRGDFILGLAEGRMAPGREMTARATLLGYDLKTRYRVASGRLESPSGDLAASDAEDMAERLDSAFDHTVIVAAQGRKVMVLMETDRHPEPAAEIAAALEPLSPAERGEWGVTSGDYSLAELARGADRAERVLEIGASLGGQPGEVAKEEELGSGLLLGILARDSEAVEIARGILQPIIDYDEQKGRDLLHTLDVFIRYHGNTSAASRALYMNRHSLMYRGRKIEELTGYSLDSYEDRFRLDLSLHILRLAGEIDVPEPDHEPE